MVPPLKIIFAGTPEFSAKHLESILKQGTHQVIAVYTQPDRPAGRGKKLLASPVKVLAERHNIPVYQPTTLKNLEAQQTLANLKADLMVVVAYGLILPTAILEAPRLGCINSHASILPRWRGAAPIQRAIQAGDKETGVTIMQMEAGLDTGPMLTKVTTAISSQDTGGSLHDRLAELGSKAITKAIDHLATNAFIAEQQDDSLATYAHKLTKEEAQINWNDTAINIFNTIRAFNPWPTAHTLIQGVPLKILEATLVNQQGAAGKILSISKEGLLVACGEQALYLTKLQLPNSKPLSFWDVYNGHKELFKESLELGQ